MLIKELENKKILIWGLGAEGREILHFLARRGLDKNICIYNDSKIDISAEFSQYPAYDGEAIESLLNEVDVVIKSPGVSLYKEEIIKAKERGVKFTSSTDICLSEIRAQKPDSKIIAISGSKGKSTSVSALYHILIAQGKKAVLGGNIGVPLIELLDKDFDYLVAEVSSYQAADLSVSPHIAMFTNLYFVHDKWHHGHENYCRDKLHLIANQQEGDICFINGRNAELVRHASEYKDKNIVKYNEENGFHAEGKKLYECKTELVDIRDLKLFGDHNLENFAGVFSIINYLGLDVKKAVEALKTFEPLAHRLQNVAVKNGVTFINDSISTAPEAAIGAMKSFDENIVIISGGEENTQDYTPYAEYIDSHQKVKMAITLFQCGPKIATKLREVITRKDMSIVESESLEEAVSLAYFCLMKQGGGVVLFSPTSPSFGKYKNFMERGQHFIDIVNKIDV